MVANLFFMIAITNLELSKVGVFIASAPALSVLIDIKLMNQRPSIANWFGIAATCSALAIIALNSVRDLVTQTSYAAEMLARSKTLFGGNNKPKSSGAIFHK